MEYIVKRYSECVEWYNSSGELHREDGPAQEFTNGDKLWYRCGKLHREDGPASEKRDGNLLCWYWNGELHREDGPAYQYQNFETKEYWIHGHQLSKEEFDNWKKPETYRVVVSGGCITWYKDGQIHREDGPAIIYGNRAKHWYKNGFKHRLDGPAIECESGYNEYWKEGVFFTTREFLDNMSIEEKLEIKIITDSWQNEF